MRQVLFVMLATSAVAMAHGDEAWFGPVRLTPGETARLAAFCGSADGCDVAFHFHDVNGRLVKESRASLVAGQSASLDFSIAALARPGELIPCIRVVRGSAFGTLQLFDTLIQRTRIQMQASGESVPRSGELHFGPTGLAGLEAGRLAAHCPAPHGTAEVAQPCEVALMFLDPNGRPVKQSTASLLPGGTAFLDLGPRELGNARRREIVPCVRVLRGAAIGGYSQIDLLTGLTTNLSGPSAATIAAPR